MPSILAIISKAVFERDAKVSGHVAGVGETVPLTRYLSKNKALAPVAEGGALFLVTVRPDDVLWLVAILESPTHDGESWNSAQNAIPITDISALKGEIQFANGSGISAKKGALGMSLQTPRVLSDADVALLRTTSGAGGAATGAGGAAAVEGRAPSATGTPAAEKGHLNAHEESEVAPCLCRSCLPRAPERFVAGELPLVRDRAAAAGRVVWYWLPESLEKNKDAIRRAVESRLHARARKQRQPHDFENLDTVFAGGGDGDDE